MTVRYKLAVADDHALVRRGIIETLEEEADFVVVGEAADAAGAMGIARDLAPDLIFLDVNMPGGGIEAAIAIHAAMPAIVIAMFSFRLDLAIVKAALDAGASGYIVKGISGSELNDVARRLLAGEAYIDPEVSRRLALEQA